MSWNSKLVEFVCQRCLQPLIFNEFKPNEYETEELKLPINPNDEEDIDAQDFDHFVGKFSMSNNDFMLISEGAITAAGGGGAGGAGSQPMLSQTLQMRAAIFDALSNNSEIDHPLCEECADSLLEMMDRQLKDAESEWNDYNNYLKRLEQTEDTPNLEKLEKELSDLKVEEEKLVKELKSLQEESENIKQTIKTQEEEHERLQIEESKWWKEYSVHRYELMQMDDKKRSLETRMTFAQSHLDELKKTNIFQTTFHIWQTGSFGIINGFRLGRLPSVPVDWSEINAAWGQSTLLLSSLAKKIDLKFNKYKLVPYGNHSYVEIISEKESERGKKLPLYGSGNFRFLWDPKFDAAIVAFLDCFEQFQAKVEEGNSGFQLPYRMSKGKIEDSGSSYSVKIQFNSEEQWTKAMKFLMTNLRWALAYISSHETNNFDNNEETR